MVLLEEVLHLIQKELRHLYIEELIRDMHIKRKGYIYTYGDMTDSTNLIRLIRGNPTR